MAPPAWATLPETGAWVMPPSPASAACVRVQASRLSLLLCCAVLRTLPAGMLRDWRRLPQLLELLSRLGEPCRRSTDCTGAARRHRHPEGTHGTDRRPVLVDAAACFFAYTTRTSHCKCSRSQNRENPRLEGRQGAGSAVAVMPLGRRHQHALPASSHLLPASTHSAPRSRHVAALSPSICDRL